MSAPPAVPPRPGSVAPPGRVASAWDSAASSVPRTRRGFATGFIAILVGLVLLMVVGAVCQIVLTAQLDDRSPTQAIVVLDPARYWGDPAPVLEARLDHAAGLYLQGTARVIVLTGPPRFETASRARLVAAGVPTEGVVAFATGADTVGTLAVVASVMRDLGWESATLITDPAQAARAQATAAGFGIDAHVSPARSGPGASMTSEYVARETAALLRFYLVNRWSQSSIITPR